MIKFKREFLNFLAISKQFFLQKDFCKYFIFIYILYFIGYFSLILNNNYYTGDEYSRGFLATNWDFGQWGRPLAEFLTQILNLSFYRKLELYPLPQLIALIFLSLGSMMIVKIVLKRLSFWGLVASLPLGLSPFFLENMSYTFDSFFMALALISPIFAFLFLKRKLTFFIISILSLLISLNTYQAANSVYIMMAIFITFIHILEGKNHKEILKEIGIFLLAFILGLLIYKIFILTHFRVDEDKVSDKTVENLAKILVNLKAVLTKYYNVFAHTVFIPIFILGIISFLFISVEKSKINNFLAIFVSIVFIVLSILLSYGGYLILEKQLFSLRTFYGIGIFISLFFIFLLKTDKKAYKFIAKTLSFILAYILIAQSTAWSNALKEQAQYAKPKIAKAVEDLKNLAPKDKNYKFGIIKNKLILAPTFSASAINLASVFPVINEGQIFDYSAPFLAFFLYPQGKMCKTDKNKLVQQVIKKQYVIKKYDNNCITITFL